MTDAQFWSLIERAKLRAGGEAFARISTLSDELKQLGNEQLIGFHNALLAAHRMAYRHDLWDVAEVAMGGGSADAFEYFRTWLISEGEHTFNAILSNPDELAAFNLRGLCSQLEAFSYVAADLLEQRGIATQTPCTGDDLPGDSLSRDEFVSRFPKLSKKWLLS
jgi:hypothetical protein